MTDGPWLGAERDFDEAVKAFQVAEAEYEERKTPEAFRRKMEALKALTEASRALTKIYEENPPFLT